VYFVSRRFVQFVEKSEFRESGRWRTSPGDVNKIAPTRRFQECDGARSTRSSRSRYVNAAVNVQVKN
jgi:hypothetical protein